MTTILLEMQQEHDEVDDQVHQQQQVDNFDDEVDIQVHQQHQVDNFDDEEESHRISTQNNASSRQLHKEFTFTGYDIMSDVDPQCYSWKNGHKMSRVYTAGCARFGAVPARSVTQNLTKVLINVTDRPLGTNGAKALAVALKNNSIVKSISLDGNNVCDAGACAISYVLQYNSTLVELNLANNAIGLQGLQALCDVLQNNHTIRYLDLSHNKIDDCGAPCVLDLLENNISLQKLNLSHNKLDLRSGEHLASALVNNDTLEELNLSWNHIRGYGATCFLTSLGSNRGLRKLNLAWNGLGDNGSMALTTTLNKNNFLEELDVTNTRLNPEELPRIMMSIVKNNTLSVLKIGRNATTPNIALKMLQILSHADPSQCALKEFILTDVNVDKSFMTILAELQKERLLRVIHGSQQHEYPSIAREVITSLNAMFCSFKQNGLQFKDVFTTYDNGVIHVPITDFVACLMKAKVPFTNTQLEEFFHSFNNKSGDKEHIDLQFFLKCINSACLSKYSSYQINKTNNETHEPCDDKKSQSVLFNELHTYFE